MPTTRTPGSKANVMRAGFSKYLLDFGTSVTLRTTTRVLDSMNRLQSKSTATSTISADIQWVTKKELDTGNLGDVKIGDGMLFVKWNSAIDINNALIHYEVSFNSEYWRIMEQIEGEVISGQVAYKGYIIRKNSQV